MDSVKNDKNYFEKLTEITIQSGSNHFEKFKRLKTINNCKSELTETTYSQNERQHYN